MIKKTYLVTSLLILCSWLLQSSCSNEPRRTPGWEYMPDMAHPVSYETYLSNEVFGDSMNAQKPVAGTIPIYQGILGNENAYMPFHYANTTEGYEAAGAELKNPLTITPEVLAEGNHLFNIYCAICHGEDGKASGHIVVGDNVTSKFPPPPSYFSDNLLALPEGKMFFSVHYGKNMMGSYTSQLDRLQIWKVISYVRGMQNDYRAAQSGTVAVTDSTKKM